MAEEEKGKRILYGNLAILTATIFWGVNYPFIKALVPELMTANGLSAIRLIGACALFWLASLFLKREKIDREDMIRIFFAGFICLFLNIFLFVGALKYGSAIDVSIISTLPPAFVILIEVVFKHKRPNWLVYDGVAVSFAGAALIILSGHHGQSRQGADAMLGGGLAALASFAFACYLVILAKPTHKYNSVSLLRWVFLFASLPSLFFLGGARDMGIWHCSKALPWLELFFILLGPTFLSFFLTQPAERDIGSVMVSIYQYITPVVAAAASIIMGVDKLRAMQVIAMLIIVAGMLLSNYGQKKKAAEK